MDSKWERVKPYISLTLEEAEEIFERTGKCIKLKKVELINNGLRNTNYKVLTEEKNYLMRIYGCKDEWGVLEDTIYDRIDFLDSSPRKIGFDLSGRTIKEPVGIFEYIEGRTLDLLSKEEPQRSEIYYIIGKKISLLHNVKYDSVGFLDENMKVREPLPPIKKWYDMFLGLEAKRKLGEELTSKLESYLLRNRENMKRIEENIALIHNDFRPINIMLSEDCKPIIIDWEGAMAGQCLRDIGQFLRFGEQVTLEDENAFVKGYNEVADIPLPKDYKELARLADLVNLIQMLNNDRDLENKDRDLIKLIRDTVEGKVI